MTTDTHGRKLPSPSPPCHKLLKRFPKPKENLYHSLHIRSPRRSRSHSNSTQVQCAHFASSTKEKRNRARAQTQPQPRFPTLDSDKLASKVREEFDGSEATEFRICSCCLFSALFTKGMRISKCNRIRFCPFIRLAQQIRIDSFSHCFFPYNEILTWKSIPLSNTLPGGTRAPIRTHQDAHQ